MPITDYTYYVGEINIPNIDKPAALQNLTVFIEQKEEEVLCNLFGYELFKAYNTGIATQRMIDLRDGVEYAYGGRLYKWRGLKQTIGSSKFSLLAYYIYYEYIQDKTTRTSGTGENIATTENSVATTPKYKSINAYNQFVNWSLELYQYLEAKSSLYPEWKFNYWCEVRKINEFNI